MAHIGIFQRTTDGYSGRLQTLTLDIDLVLVPAEPSEVENAPDYRIHLGSEDDAPEVGAGWKRNGEKAGEYVSLLLDDPVFTQPIHANLFQSARGSDAFHLTWNRSPKRRETA